MAKKPTTKAKSPPAKALPTPKAKAKPAAVRAKSKAVKPAVKRAIPRSTVRTNRTVRARKLFLKHLEETCNVTGAARAAGMGRSSAYEWREADPDFAAAWDEALESAADELERVAFERAKEGKSERMLEILLKAHRPKYREKQRLEHTGADGGPIEYQRLSDEEVEARIRAHEAALEGGSGG